MRDHLTWKRIWPWLLVVVLAALAVAWFGIVGGLGFGADPAKAASEQLARTGGVRFVLAADPAQVAHERIEVMEEHVRGALRLARQPIRFGDVSTADGRLSFIVEDAANVGAARAAILPLIGGGPVSDWSLQVGDGGRFTLTLTKAAQDKAVSDAIASAVPVLQKRIDAVGAHGAIVRQMGGNRIVVELSALDRPEDLEPVLVQRGKLEFRPIDVSAVPSDIALGLDPPGDEILSFAEGSPDAGNKVPVKRLGGISGASLAGAMQSFNSQTDEPVVHLTFNPQGTAEFAKLTGENVGKPFAIVLDGQVLTAPIINEPIVGGEAEINGNFTVESANQLAIELRSGALPVDLAIVDQSTFGPATDAESIRAGTPDPMHTPAND